MSELWQEMRQLRKKHEDLFPIIKLQKVFRGWRVREHSRRANEGERDKMMLQSMFFEAWKSHTQRQLKLQHVLNRKYLLIDGKEGRIM
jgi:hypothetical protein